MKKSLLSLAVGAVIGLASVSAAATPIAIDIGIDTNSVLTPSNGSSKTTAIDNLGYTGTLATSIYLGDPVIAGTKVIDTNISSVMNSYGFSAGSKPNLLGSNIPFSYPLNPQQLNINALNTATDLNGFQSGEGAPAYGVLGAWGLTYDYYFMGETTGSGVKFDSGFINVYYQDGGTSANSGKQVLKLNVTGSQLDLSNLSVFGNISFDFGTGVTTDSFVQNFWLNGEPGGSSFYADFLADPLKVSWTLNTNVVPPVPTKSQLWQAPDGAFFRQTSLNGQIDFNVPEPGSLALLGLGLAGLGLAQRRRKAAK